ncbi:hypothetical protein OG2516_05908 [Oceanicola granulosus HTCC2516]|uniref:Transglycosylase SLT domain-containing protein n=1 Tax=Oceanicola granulosus (strain ATCC BAA-861 / DSM 15982 / KCTC 12143 / HTCC2516) TaxID=314256 RepID=Q2CIH0_OCEGH|nr:transglycosylase SLT domain-containing protein [Oceanicola granulosus]EAR52619.1 hypothetical protein OG2516_05908 [Oceanicola granulosus HTCC2516]
MGLPTTTMHRLARPLRALGLGLLAAAAGLAAPARAEVASLAVEPVVAVRATVSPPVRPPFLESNGVPIHFEAPPVQPPIRPVVYIPETRWDHRPDGDVWTLAAMQAIASHGSGLEDLMPHDIETWCPAYDANPEEQRRAFWVGMMSALAYYESRWQPTAVGGGGRWFGLLQIYPPTARHYGCRARTGEALKDPEDNLSCAVRIATAQVRRAGSVARGMRDWGPFHNARMRAEMAAWTREQAYCKPNLAVLTSLRPQSRPLEEVAVVVSTMGLER